MKIFNDNVSDIIEFSTPSKTFSLFKHFHPIFNNNFKFYFAVTNMLVFLGGIWGLSWDAFFVGLTWFFLLQVKMDFLYWTWPDCTLFSIYLRGMNRQVQFRKSIFVYNRNIHEFFEGQRRWIFPHDLHILITFASFLST